MIKKRVTFIMTFRVSYDVILGIFSPIFANTSMMFEIARLTMLENVSFMMTRIAFPMIFRVIFHVRKGIDEHELVDFMYACLQYM